MPKKGYGLSSASIEMYNHLLVGIVLGRMMGFEPTIPRSTISCFKPLSYIRRAKFSAAASLVRRRFVFPIFAQPNNPEKPCRSSDAGIIFPLSAMRLLGPYRRS